MTSAATLLEAPPVAKAFREGVDARGGGAAEVLVEQYVFVGSEDEAYAAAPLWQFAAVEHLVRDMDDPRDIQRTAEEHVNLDDVIAPWLVSVDPAEHVERLQVLFDAGATHVAIHSVQPDQRRLIEFYGSDVLPRLG